jgi:hypothetical protein
MPSNWATVGFLQIAAQMDGAVSWLRGLGIDVTNSRVGHYRRVMERLAVADERRDATELRALFPMVVDPLFEANEIGSIYAAFGSGVHDDYVRARITALRSGPLRYTDEVGSNTCARDLAFELLLAARLVSGGLQLDPAIASDIAVHAAPRRLIFECKRPGSEERVERRVREAKNQIHAKCDAGGRLGSLGVIAVDLTKLVNPEFQLLTGITKAAGTRALGDYLEHYWRAHSRLWGAVESRKVVGVILRLSVMAHFTDDTGLAYCQQYALAEMPGAKEAARRSLRALGEAMNTANAVHGVGRR